VREAPRGWLHQEGAPHAPAHLRVRPGPVVDAAEAHNEPQASTLQRVPQAFQRHAAVNPADASHPLPQGRKIATMANKAG
jgi:hypothetical protein